MGFFRASLTGRGSRALSVSKECAPWTDAAREWTGLRWRGGFANEPRHPRVRVIWLNGTVGSGKTAVGRALAAMLPHAAFADGDDHVGPSHLPGRRRWRAATTALPELIAQCGRWRTLVVAYPSPLECGRSGPARCRRLRPRSRSPRVLPPTARSSTWTTRRRDCGCVPISGPTGPPAGPCWRPPLRSCAAGLRVEKGKAAAWVGERLPERGPGQTTVLFHSIAWEYSSNSTKGHIRDAVEAVGQRADADAPFAWLRLEPPAGGARVAADPSCA